MEEESLLANGLEQVVAGETRLEEEMDGHIEPLSFDGAISMSPDARLKWFNKNGELVLAATVQAVKMPVIMVTFKSGVKTDRERLWVEFEKNGKIIKIDHMKVRGKERFGGTASAFMEELAIKVLGNVSTRTWGKIVARGWQSNVEIAYNEVARQAGREHYEARDQGRKNSVSTTEARLLVIASQELLELSDSIEFSKEDLNEGIRHPNKKIRSLWLRVAARQKQREKERNGSITR